MVISKHSLSPQNLQIGSNFSFSMTVKNDSGKAAASYTFTGFIRVEVLDENDNPVQVRDFDLIRVDKEESWANGASKNISVSGTVSQNIRDRLISIKLRYPNTNIHSHEIIWGINLYGKDNMDIDDGGVFAGTLGGRFYNQSIDLFALERVLDGVPNDEGTNLMTDIKISMYDDFEWELSELFTLKLYYAANANATTASSFIDLTEEIPNLLSGVTDNLDLITQTFANNLNWNFLLVFGDAYESVQARTTVPRAFANLHLSGASTGGAAFGGFSTATEDNPLFECHYPAKLYGSMEVSGTAAITGATALKGGISNFGSSVQGGTITISSVADGSTKDGTVKFSKAFKSAPFVMISGYSSSTSAGYGSMLFAIVSGSITTSQFKIRVFNDSGSAKNPDIRWIAIGTM